MPTHGGGRACTATTGSRPTVTVRAPPIWTAENRPRYYCDRLRHPSDLTDTEWALVEPMIPPAKHSGCRHTIEVRARDAACAKIIGTAIDRPGSAEKH
jgi:hypothetical protein